MYKIKQYKTSEMTFNFIEVKQRNIEVTFMDYGATILSIFVPDKNQKMETVLLAYSNLNDYIENKRYLNAVVGPTAGRIKNAQFEIDGNHVYLDKNSNEKHNLHGGKDALSYVFFDYEIVDSDNQTLVIFTTEKKQENQNYPGNQKYRIVYTIKRDAVEIEYFAETDKPTLVNLTNHAYFNMSGNLKNNILNNEIQIHASKVIELDIELIPARIKNIDDNECDLRELKTIGNKQFSGIDKPYILDDITIDKIQATLIDKESKRRLDVYTTYPCIVCYTDNFPMPYNLLFDAENEKYMGVCFEAQKFPYNIKPSDLDVGVLRPNEKYYHRTIYKFSII